MITEETAVFPKIAQRILDLQAEFNLPIHITLGETTDSLRVVTFEYEYIEDYHLYAWIVNRANNSYLREEEGIIDEEEEVCDGE